MTKYSLSFIGALVGAIGAAQAETVTLPATANAGLSSIYEESAQKKPDQQGWSWSGHETLALRQNQNWSKFENKTILLRFDTTRIQGWTVKEASLHLALAKDDLYGVGACTVLSDWQEGRLDGQWEPGAPSWNYRAGPQAGQRADERHLWAWPGSAFYSVAWLHPALRYSHAGPDRITRYTDAQGVRWLKVPVEPALVHALAIGASYGLVLTDDKGQVAEANMLEKNPKPYVYDPSFEIEVYSRHTKGGTLAPRLEVAGEAGDRAPPAAPKAARAVAPVGRAGATVGIEFIAPGDDGMAGCAHAYRVRYAEKAITEANWAHAAEIPRYALPLPRPGGQRQFLHLMTLKPGSWHVAIRAVDEAGNEGPPCNVDVEVSEPTRRRFVEVRPKDGPGVNGWSFDGTFAVWAVDDQWKVDPVAPAEEAAAWKQKEVDGRKAPGAVQLKAARNEVVAFQLVLERRAGAVGDVKVAVSDLQGPGGAVIAAARHVELFREWYFATDGGAAWVPDACLPLAAPLPETLQVPARDNVGEAQQNQAVWVDLYVPRTAAPGEYRGTITLTTPALKEPAVINVVLAVRALTLPDEITWPVELNTYGGIGAFAGVDIAREPDRYLKMERSYYQLAHKHRCTVNILRYRHSGAITENGAPPLAGEGASRRIADWSAWDARFGPYLDGLAFTEASGYYGPGMGTPVTHFYLPCHENWPMDLDRYYADRADFSDRKAFAEWAKRSRRPDETVAPEYVAGYRKVIGDMMRHFAEKRWTRTAFQFFLNNKYYYKCPFFVEPGLGMSGHGTGRSYWLLDEPVDFDDMDANRFFLSLGREAVKESGVRDIRVHFRVDVSYPQMVRGLWDGVCNLWCSSALGEVATTARVRRMWMPGEEWSTYGAGITVSDPAVKQLQLLLNRYSLGAVYVLPYWTNFGAGWRKADDTSIYYPGVHYAGTDKTYDGALPGLRMKLLRRAQQDVEYLNLLARCRGWDRDQVIQALAVWADAPNTATGPDFSRLSPERAAQLREAVAATIEAESR
jgi:hypothetical protein